MRIYILFYFVVALQLLSHDPMDYSMPGFSVLHYLLEFAQTHVQFILFFFQLYWDITDIQHCVSLRCIAWWFNIRIHCKMIEFTLLATFKYIIQHSYVELSYSWYLELSCSSLHPQYLFILQLEVCNFLPTTLNFYTSHPSGNHTSNLFLLIWVCPL